MKKPLDSNAALVKKRRAKAGVPTIQEQITQEGEMATSWDLVSGGRAELTIVVCSAAASAVNGAGVVAPCALVCSSAAGGASVVAVPQANSTNITVNSSKQQDCTSNRNILSNDTINMYKNNNNDHSAANDNINVVVIETNSSGGSNMSDLTPPPDRKDVGFGSPTTIHLSLGDECNTQEYNSHATAGYVDHVTAGYNNRATSGYNNHVTTGYNDYVTAGYNDHVTAGYNDHVTGDQENRLEIVVTRGATKRSAQQDQNQCNQKKKICKTYSNPQ